MLSKSAPVLYLAQSLCSTRSLRLASARKDTKTRLSLIQCGSREALGNNVLNKKVVLVTTHAFLSRSVTSRQALYRSYLLSHGTCQQRTKVGRFPLWVLEFESLKRSLMFSLFNITSSKSKDSFNLRNFRQCPSHFLAR